MIAIASGSQRRRGVVGSASVSNVCKKLSHSTDACVRSTLSAIAVSLLRSSLFAPCFVLVARHAGTDLAPFLRPAEPLVLTIAAISRYVSVGGSCRPGRGCSLIVGQPGWLRCTALAAA